LDAVLYREKLAITINFVVKNVNCKGQPEGWVCFEGSEEKYSIKIKDVKS